ncbi:hypothetical protein B0H21DRAFT_863863 [Amylocystis lapponica]|nr:hypothetical protein B0H21DRAFT_863863 [Amylocystis lapponica]
MCASRCDASRRVTSSLLTQRSSAELDSKKRHDILRQIGTLQLPNPPAVLLTFPASSPKRKQPPPGGLAPASPSPIIQEYMRYDLGPPMRGRTNADSRNLDRPPEAREYPFAEEEQGLKRHRQRLAPLTAEGDEADTSEGADSAEAGSDRLALTEELVPGPVEHTTPCDDLHFEKPEQNSVHTHRASSLYNVLMSLPPALAGDPVRCRLQVGGRNDKVERVIVIFVKRDRVFANP